MMNQIYKETYVDPFAVDDISLLGEHFVRFIQTPSISNDEKVETAAGVLDNIMHIADGMLSTDEPGYYFNHDSLSVALRVINTVMDNCIGLLAQAGLSGSDTVLRNFRDIAEEYHDMYRPYAPVDPAPF